MNPSRRQVLQAGGLLLFTALSGRTAYLPVWPVLGAWAGVPSVS